MGRTQALGTSKRPTERKAHSYSTLHRLSAAITGTSLRTMSSRTWPSRASPPSQLRSQTLRIRREITGITCRPLGRDPILTTALRSVAKAVPSPCLSNAFVAKAVPLPCVFPMISWLRQCLRLVFFSAFVAEAVPFLAGLRSVLATIPRGSCTIDMSRTCCCTRRVSGTRRRRQCGGATPSGRRWSPVISITSCSIVWPSTCRQRWC